MDLHDGPVKEKSCLTKTNEQHTPIMRASAKSSPSQVMGLFELSTFPSPLEKAGIVMSRRKKA